MIRLIFGAYLLFLLLPIALLAIGSFGSSWTNTALPTGVTTRWYGELWLDKSFRSAFATSLVVALSACMINALVGLPLAYSLYHAGMRGSQTAARIVSSLPIAVPTITLGFGYMIVFNSDWMPWLSSLPLLILAHAVHTLPYLVATLLADMRHLNLTRIENMAATLGASPLAVFITVVVPNLRQSLLSGLVMVAAISIGEFGISNLIASFQTRTYPVVLLQAFYGATGFACAATVILLGLAALASVSSSALTFGARTRGGHQ